MIVVFMHPIYVPSSSRMVAVALAGSTVTLASVEIRVSCAKNCSSISHNGSLVMLTVTSIEVMVSLNVSVWPMTAL